MIRFSCHNCGREYVLADALAHLPLICKACGQRLEVPDPTPEPESPPPPPPPPVVSLPAPPVPAPQPTLKTSFQESPLPASPGDYAEENGNGLLSSDTLAKLDASLAEAAVTTTSPIRESGPETPATASKEPPPPASPPDDASAERSRKIFAGIADAILVVMLLAAGILVGEMVARKPTATIFREAGSAPVFPPTDLLIWLGCAAFFPLIYAWLGTRGWTLGAWLRRRGD